MKDITFNEFCEKYCDGLYDQKFTYEEKCTGYIQLKKMVTENICPASLKEIERWENEPTHEEVFSIPDIKYLRFLHPNLRPYIIGNWKKIKQLII